MKKSLLKDNPKSKILKRGYINIYSKLTPQEKRQIKYKTKYKAEMGNKWDDSMVFLSNEFKKYAKSGLVLLDAGCGNGNYVIDENRGLIDWAVGVDISSDSVKKNICLDEIKISSLESLPFAAETFDIVTSLWVLEHVKDPDKVLVEINRVLKPGGVFMFAAPNKNYLPLRLINIVKGWGVNETINKKLFGRDAEDVFEAFYKANTVIAIKKASRDLFSENTLFYNFDPSYTSFNYITYKISIFAHKVSSKLDFTFTFPHIVGVLKKKVR